MSHLLREDRDGVAWLTINRPERRNAMSPEVICRLADTWDELRDSSDVRAVVLSGAGDEAFCSGADLGLLMPLLTGSREPGDEWDARGLADPDLIFRALLKNVPLYTPVIAAVNGYALAGGCELVLATDLRVASTTARFGLSEPKRGLVPAGGGMSRLPRQLPHAIAMELLLTGEAISADAALAYGFVNRVVEPARVLGEAAALAELIAANGPLAVRVIKQTVLETSGVPYPEAFHTERRNAEVVRTSADAVEGPLAFVEKRPPRFTGR
jgi:enoyl-CoA hydratase